MTHDLTERGQPRFASAARGLEAARVEAGFTISVTQQIAEIEDAWRALEAAGVQSPGQSYDFNRLWIETLSIPAPDQAYVLAEVEGRPVALLALCRRKRLGLSVWTWFLGSHVGCNAPLLDAASLQTLGASGRRALWQQMAQAVPGADMLYLPAIAAEGSGLFDELGVSIAGDTLFRAEFSSWEECDADRRSKSRRKHDRQQADKLAALGTVGFEETVAGECAEVLEVMFRQRSARFATMGIRDPFASCGIREFYEAAARPGSGVDVRLHVLRLDEKIVAVRYNVAHGNRLFCLISSMSDDREIQTGSPGKQCLLRVMPTVFDQGFRTFDIGAGLTDEKRQWCNRQIPLRQHYVALTPKGRIAAGLHRMLQQARQKVKSNPKLLAPAKRLRLWWSRLRGRAAV